MTSEPECVPLLVCVVGPPHAGKKAVARALAERTNSALMVSSDFRHILEYSSSTQAIAARKTVAAGNVLSPAARSALWIEALPRKGDVILPSYPVSKAELDALRAGSNRRVVLVILQATRTQINQRRLAEGLQKIEDALPGAIERNEKALGEMVDSDRSLVETGLVGTPAEVAEVVAKKHWPDL